MSNTHTENTTGGYDLLPPTWETAARIYCAVLQNPKAAATARRNAEEEILRLARGFDSLSRRMAFCEAKGVRA